MKKEKAESRNLALSKEVSPVMRTKNEDPPKPGALAESGNLGALRARQSKTGGCGRIFLTRHAEEVIEAGDATGKGGNKNGRSRTGVLRLVVFIRDLFTQDMGELKKA